MNTMTSPRVMRQIEVWRYLAALLIGTILTGSQLFQHQIFAGTIAAISTVEEVTTGDAGNEDYTGEFEDNPNHFKFKRQDTRIAAMEAVFAVLDSGNTTEYALTVAGGYNSESDPPLTDNYQVQVGFGTGENFVPALDVFSELDFDAPLPSDPALKPTVSIFGVFDVFNLAQHSPDTITWE